MCAHIWKIDVQIVPRNNGIRQKAGNPQMQIIRGIEKNVMGGGPALLNLRFEFAITLFFLGSFAHIEIFVLGSLLFELGKPQKKFIFLMTGP